MAEKFIPYGRQSIAEEEIEEVVRVLRSDFLTQGPAVERFEKAVAEYCGVRHAIAVSSGTAALHALYAALGIGPGDEIITSPITFAATSNAAHYLGAKAVFADVDFETGLISPKSVASKLSEKTKAIVPVDFAGRPADYDALRVLADSAGVPLVADAAHSLGASYGKKKVGQLADATIFSFHPVKTITTCEGGMIVTDQDEIAEKMKTFRHHGIVRNQEIAKREGEWFYEMRELGNNYRLSDLHAAVGIAQIGKIERFLARRREIAARYDQAFSKNSSFLKPVAETGLSSARHLYLLRLKESLVSSRRELFENLKKRGIGTQVHYIPVYKHPYYKSLGYSQDSCPQAERFYASTLSLPMYPAMSDSDITRVIENVQELVSTKSTKA